LCRYVKEVVAAWPAAAQHYSEEVGLPLHLAAASPVSAVRLALTPGCQIGCIHGCVQLLAREERGGKSQLYVPQWLSSICVLTAK
jgi:hypothetical protein